MLFHIDIAVDERIILTGYDVSDKSLILPNLMLIFCSIHNLSPIYIISNYTTKVTNVYKLLAEFKRELIINLKFLVKMKLIDFTQKQFSELESG